jgi:metallophosphoesterase superfamily enzyme
MKRLSEQYPLHTPVEIYFELIDHWLAGVVVGHQHPAVWVQTADGRQWFVTNGRRIRPSPQS